MVFMTPPRFDRQQAVVHLEAWALRTNDLDLFRIDSAKPDCSFSTTTEAR
jgi:hypothetical protein